MLKTAVIGMGNMGSQYAAMIASQKTEGLELAAVTRISEERMAALKDILPQGLPVYQSAKRLYQAVDAGELELDSVIIATPHYSHEEIAVQAFARGLHVLCDKPAGVYTRQARRMEEAYARAKEKAPYLRYGFIFHQRTYPVYNRLRELVRSRRYGEVKRVNWVVTDWYRPNVYYTENTWRGTWERDGGGTLLNQCPHNLDLIQWICGLPQQVQGFCHEGKYHPVRVEDEVTAYMEWENGATGTFIASTGEASGISRLEISLDNALIVCESDRFKIYELDKPEYIYRTESTDAFVQPKGSWKEEKLSVPAGPYETVLNGFAKGVMTAEGEEAWNSLALSNAIYLSSWEKRMVKLPVRNTEEEREFEQRFETRLQEKINFGG